MGQGARVGRRALLAAGAAAALTPELSGCTRGTASADAIADARWVGADASRGHRLRPPHGGPLPAAAVQRRADVLVVGAGIAGLAAARALQRAGIEDIALLELEDAPGGNSRGHQLDGRRCPLGAHYLPVPAEPAHEVLEWLHELGLMTRHAGRSVPDERHLCHSPQERLFIDGAWHEGVLPPAEPGSATLRQYQAFAREVAAAQRLGFALPTRRAPWTPTHAALDAQTFAAWLDQRGFGDPRLRWYLDYACRDDYGAPAAEVSAWAGLHYFASRHGFHAPGDESGERDAVFTWPEGNAWLTEHLAAPQRGRLHVGRTVLQLREARHAVELLAIDEASGRAEAWHARAAIVSVPLFVAARILESPPAALGAALALQRRSPWLVANLLLREPLLDRGIGAPPAWDNVHYGSNALGYVDAGHQRLDPRPAPTVITAYRALAADERTGLLHAGAPAWTRRIVDELLPLHPDLAAKLQQVALMRYGHAMSVPVPGLRGSSALAALAQPGSGRLHFAHADLAGYSVFEEAFTVGNAAGSALGRQLRAAA
jgi:monoamine oxidase